MVFWYCLNQLKGKCGFSQSELKLFQFLCERGDDGILVLPCGLNIDWLVGSEVLELE